MFAKVYLCKGKPFQLLGQAILDIYILFTSRSSLENDGVNSRMHVRIWRRCDNPKKFIFRW